MSDKKTVKVPTGELLLIVITVRDIIFEFFLELSCIATAE